MGRNAEPDRETDALANAIIGAAIEVHKHLGPGFLESVYENAMAVEMKLRGLQYERQHPIAVAYKGHSVGEGRVDIMAGGRLPIELKAVDTVLPIHRAQLISYLKALTLPLGLLINFKVRLMRDGVERIVFSAQ